MGSRERWLRWLLTSLLIVSLRRTQHQARYRPWYYEGNLRVGSNMPQVSYLSIQWFCPSQSCHQNSYSMCLPLPSIYLLMICERARVCYHRCGCDCCCDCQLIQWCFQCFIACLILQGYHTAFHSSNEGVCDHAWDCGRDHVRFHESGLYREDRRSFLVKRTRRFRDRWRRKVVLG